MNEGRVSWGESRGRRGEKLGTPRKKIKSVFATGVLIICESSWELCFESLLHYIHQSQKDLGLNSISNRSLFLVTSFNFQKPQFPQ
jgi:hypothetical protein